MGRFNIYIPHTADDSQSVTDYTIHHNLGAPIARSEYMIHEPIDEANEVVALFFGRNYPGHTNNQIVNIDENTCIITLPNHICSNKCGICLTLVAD